MICLDCKQALVCRFGKDEIYVLIGPSIEATLFQIDSCRIKYADNSAYELTGQSVSGTCSWRFGAVGQTASSGTKRQPL